MMPPLRLLFQSCPRGPPSKFKNSAFLMEKRAEGKAKKSESVQRLEESSVVGECNLRLARLLFFFAPPPTPLPFSSLSPSAAHEA